MKHLSEDELVLLHYGEAGESATDHVASCSECRQESERLTALLGTIHVSVPEPSVHYERELWRRLQPKIDSLEQHHPGRGVYSGFAASTLPSPAIKLAAMAAVVVLAFIAGMWFERPQTVVRVESANQIPADARERALLLAVGGHLERVQIMLLEIANKAPAQTIDISTEQDATRTLLPDNRLYRETATQLGDVQTATLLDELERLLLDLSHRPATMSLSDFDDIRDRMKDEGILFKVRIAGSELRSRQRL
jgi:hypothetical protein